MKSYTVVLSGKEYEILQDKDGKFIKPDFVKQLESYGTDVKPAHEPICVGRKPLESTVANNVLKHGTGGLNIDGTRVKTSDSLDGGGTIDKTNYETVTLPSVPVRGVTGEDNGGRFPANLIHDGSDEVVGLFPDTSGGKYQKQSRQRKGFMISGSVDNVQEANAPDNYGDSGSAARFFYCAKSSKSERNLGLEGFEEKERGNVSQYMTGTESNWINDPRHKDGGYEMSPAKPSANHHPTVKPLSLTKYLATLIKPPTGGRLLVPFSGSGSEMIGALQAGWEYVEGVELTEEYIPIAEARIKYWTNNIKVNKDGTISPIDVTKPSNLQTKVEQISLI